MFQLERVLDVLKRYKDLLWSAPELLRDENLRKKGTQPGDVYSFGIVMQEVVVRGEPFCMLSLSPEDIIEKVKRPPPLIRPSVSKGAAPPEAINIMRQCWAEQADMRPDFHAVHDLFKKLNHGRKVNFVDTMFQMLEKYSNNLEELIRERTEQLDMEKKKTEQLLNRMLPSSVADKLKLGMPVDPEDFSEVTIYFSDIVGFTTISAYSTPFEVVDLLNDLYTCFDATINAFNVYKVETIGDAYMVVGGLPVRIPDHADQIATMALHLLHQSGRFKIRHLPFTPLRLRIGLHTGPCCAGVVGLTMPRYCLFGDTVNTASRMESTGSAWRIHISQETKEKLDDVGGYQLEYRGETELKGKGKMPTYWLLGKADFDKPLPTPPPIGESHGLDERLIHFGRQGNNNLPGDLLVNPADTTRTNSSTNSFHQPRSDDSDNCCEGSNTFFNLNTHHSFTTSCAKNSVNPQCEKNVDCSSGKKLLNSIVDQTLPPSENKTTFSSIPDQTASFGGCQNARSAFFDQLVPKSAINFHPSEPKSVQKVCASIHGETIQEERTAGDLGPDDPVFPVTFDAIPLRNPGKADLESGGKGNFPRSLEYNPPQVYGSVVKSTSADHSMSSGMATPVSASEVASALLGVSSSSSLNNSQYRSSRDQKLGGFHHRKMGHVDEDLSTPYNHYRCLSPSENLHHNNHYIKSHHTVTLAPNRFLKRQFSLDRAEEGSASTAPETQPPPPPPPVSAATTTTNKRLFKQNSAGAAHDLERIEEIPLNNSGSPRHFQSSTTTCYRHRGDVNTFPNSSMSVESLNRP